MVMVSLVNHFKKSAPGYRHYLLLSAVIPAKAGNQYLFLDPGFRRDDTFY